METFAHSLESLESERRGARARKVLRKLAKDKGALFGLVMVLLVIVAAIFAPLLSPTIPSSRM
jgi:ABC-type antimicrobial peptide transport system permease subunit